MPKKAQEIASMLLHAIGLKTSYKQADLTFIDDYALLHRDTFESLLDDLFQERDFEITRAFLELYDEGFNYRNFKENQNKIYEFDLTVTQVMKKNILSDGATLNLCINTWAYFFDNQIQEKDFDYKAQMQLEEIVKNQRAQLVDIDSKILTCRHHLEKDEKKYDLKNLRIYKKSMDKFPKIIQKIKDQVYQNQLEIAHLNSSQFVRIKERHHSIYHVELDQLMKDIAEKKEMVDPYYQTRVRQHLVKFAYHSFMFLMRRLMMLSLILSFIYLLFHHVDSLLTLLNIPALQQLGIILTNIGDLIFVPLQSFLIYLFYIPLLYFLLMIKPLTMRILSIFIILLLITLDLYGVGLFLTPIQSYPYLSWLFHVFDMIDNWMGLIYAICLLSISIYLVIKQHTFLNLVFRISFISLSLMLLITSLLSIPIVDLLLYSFIIILLLILIISGIIPIFKIKTINIRKRRT